MDQSGRRGGTAPMPARPMQHQPMQHQQQPMQQAPMMPMQQQQQQQQGYPGYPQQQQQQQPMYDAAMVPTQSAQLNLEGWNPQISAGRGALAWIAIVLCGWMALVRLGQAGLSFMLMGSGATGTAVGGVLSLVAAGFYVWATIGLHQQNPKAYRAVMRVNAVLAVLGLISTFFAFAGTGFGIATIISLVGVVFHLIALLITYVARDNLGNEWAG